MYAATGRLQGTHRAPYHDPQRRNRQRALIPQLFRRPSPEEHIFQRALGWCAFRQFALVF